MKHQEGFKMRKLGRERFVVAEGRKLIDFNKMIKLNDSAAYLWEETVDKEFSVEDLAKLLEDKYAIDHETSMKDSEKIAGVWMEIGIVTE